MRRLLSHRDARIYIGGQGLSTLGDSALWLAMGIWVKMLTGSNSAAGLVFFAFTTGLVTAPLTGTLADRLRRRPLLVGTNLATGVMVCALLLVSGRGQIWLVYPVMFAYGVSNGLITSAQTALLPVLLPEDLLGDANAALQMASQGLRVVSPLLGAGLLALLGPVPVIALDAGTFGVAAVAVAVLRLREPAPVPASGHWRAEVTAGIRHIGATPVLRRLLIAGVITLCAFGFFETIPFAVIAQGLHRTPPFLGVLESVMGVGAIAGGVLAAAVMRRTGERVLVALALAAGAAACLLMATAWLAAVLGAMMLLGLCVVWVNVGAITLVQRRTPPEVIGRVDGALTVALTVPQALSIAIGAALIAVVNYRVLLAGMALVIMVAAGYLVTLREPRAVPAPAAAGAGGDPGERAGLGLAGPALPADPEA